MKASGCTEQERSKAISMLKAGSTMEQVKAAFGEVEPEYFDRNEADFLKLAGVKPAKNPLS